MKTTNIECRYRTLAGHVHDFEYTIHTELYEKVANREMPEYCAGLFYEQCVFASEIGISKDEWNSLYRSITTYKYTGDYRYVLLDIRKKQQQQ